MTLPKKCQNTEFFWSLFSRIWTEYRDLLRKSPYSFQILENADQKRLRIGTFFAQCDWIGNAAVASKSVDTSYKITKLVKFSPKCDSHLQKIHEEEYYENKENCSSKFTTLRLFSGTRWTVRASSLASIYENYQELKELWCWCLT